VGHVCERGTSLQATPLLTIYFESAQLRHATLAVSHRFGHHLLGKFLATEISSPKYRANRIPQKLRLENAQTKEGGGRIWNQQERVGAISSKSKAGGRSERAQEIKPKSKNSTRLMVTGGVRLRHQENMSDSLTLDNYVKVCVTSKYV